MGKMNPNLMGPTCVQLDIYQMNLAKRLNDLVASMGIFTTLSDLSSNNLIFITRNGGNNLSNWI